MHVAETKKVSTVEFQLSSPSGLMDGIVFPATLCDRMGRGLPNQRGTPEPWCQEFSEALLFKHNWLPTWPVFVSSPSWGQTETQWPSAPTPNQIWCGPVPPKFLLLDYPVWPNAPRQTKILLSGMTFQEFSDYLLEAKGKVKFRLGWILYCIPWKVSKSRFHWGGEEVIFISIFSELYAYINISSKLALEQNGY